MPGHPELPKPEATGAAAYISWRLGLPGDTSRRPAHTPTTPTGRPDLLPYIHGQIAEAMASAESPCVERFYFRVIENGVEGPLDQEGIEYPNLAAAVSDTEEVVAQMAESIAPGGTRTIEVVICDEQGQPVARVSRDVRRH